MGRFEKGNSLGGRTHGAKNKLTRHGITSNDVIVLKSFYEKFIGSVKSDSFYVYEHTYNGECFYIGKGYAGRAWEVKDGCRNDYWHEYTLSIGMGYDINIVSCGLTEQEALTIERSLIMLRNPKCNIYHNTISTNQPALFDNN